MILLGLVGVVGAGQAAPMPVEPEAEIVVTGERVPKLLKEIASSVEVYTRARIAAEAGADRLDQLLDGVPNVQLGNGSQGPTIRGQDSTGVLADLPGFLGGARPRVTLSVDGRAASFNEFLFGAAPLWDVEQVEVFRSPQSTVQGRNAIAGAIHLRTASPSWEWHGRARGIVGDDGLFQSSLVASGPIVADRLAFRLAADYRHIRPASDIADVMRGADPGVDHYALLRFKLLARPGGGGRIELTAGHTRSQAPQVERIVEPFKRRADPLAGYGVFRNRITTVTARLDQPLTRSLASQLTVSLGRSRFQRFAPAGVGEAITRVTDAQVETLLDWRQSDRLRLSGGVHWLDSRLDQQIDLSAIVGVGGFDDRQSSLGLFGEARFRPLPKLELTAGLRFQRDTQDRQGAVRGPVLTLPIDYDRRFTALLPKVALAYSPDARWTLGVLAQRAYNPGGTSLNFETGGPELFDAEFLWSYEFFARARLLDGRVRLSANLFRNHHRDAQRAEARTFRIPGSTRSLGWSRLYNVARAQSHGAEISAEWRPIGTLSLRGGIGLLDTRIGDDEDTPALLRDKRFQRSPRLTLSGGVEWRPARRLQLSAQVRGHSRYFSNDANSDALSIDGGSRVDARADYDAGPVRLFAYARNLRDDFRMTFLNSPTAGTAIEPRRVGVGLEAGF